MLRCPCLLRDALRVYAALAVVLGFVGALLVFGLTVHEPLTVAAVPWSLAVLLAVLGVYSAWALLGGKM